MDRFAAGKPTALIVDVGYANTSTVPVVDGYALRAGTSTQRSKSYTDGQDPCASPSDPHS
jgi:hypothetical protein